MARLKKKLKNDLIFHSVRAAVGLFNFLPRRAGVFISSWLGYTAYLLLKKDRRRAGRHLYLAFGDDLTPGQRNRIARDMFINIGRNFTDVVRYPEQYHRQIRPLIDVEGMGYFADAYRRGKGLIAVTGHIGNFELLTPFFTNEGFKTAVIGRELYDRRLDDLIIKNRASFGVVNIDTGDSAKKLLRILREGYAVGILIDTDSFRVRSVPIPVFGRLSNTPVGQAILGIKAGAAFVPIACLRDGKRYRVIIRPEIRPGGTGDIEKDAYEMTKKCTEVLTEIVKQHKDQWIWMHNRWHTRLDKKDYERFVN